MKYLLLLFIVGWIGCREKNDAINAYGPSLEWGFGVDSSKYDSLRDSFVIYAHSCIYGEDCRCFEPERYKILVNEYIITCYDSVVYVYNYKKEKLTKNYVKKQLFIDNYVTTPQSVKEFEDSIKKINR